MIDIVDRFVHLSPMLSFPRHFSWLYITTFLLATAPSCTPALRSATGPSPAPETVPPAATAPAHPVQAQEEPAPPKVSKTTEQIPAPEVPATQVPAEIPVASLQKSSKDLAREREELLKYEEAVRLFREESRTAEAYSMLDGFLAMHPDSSYADDAVLEQARIRIFEDQPRKAISILKRLLHEFPTSHLKKTAKPCALPCHWVLVNISSSHLP